MAMMMTKMKSLGESLMQKGIVDAEFNNYKSRLDAAVASLRLLRDQIPSGEATWKEVAYTSKHYVECFIDSYPDEDVMRKFVRETDRSCEKLHRALTFTNEGKHWDCDNVVSDFIEEVEDIDYKAVFAAQNEMAKYSRKLDVLRKAKSFDEERFARNEEKFDVVKANYERVLHPTVARMRELWDKVPVAFAAVFIAFWGSQVRAVGLSDLAFGDTKEFVEAHIDMLKDIRIRDISGGELEKTLLKLDVIPSWRHAVKVMSGTELLTPKRNVVVTAVDKQLPTSPVGVDEMGKETTV